MAKNPKWTLEEDKILIKVYEKENKDYILSLLPNRNWCGIQSRASSFKLERMNYFSDEEIKFIKKNYSTMNSGEIGEKLGRDSKVVKNKARELGLRKQPRWTKEEESFLLFNFNILSLEEISKKINKSISSLYHKVQELGLQKKTERYTMSNDELLESLSLISEEIGRTPSSNELKNLGLPSSTVFTSRFGSYGEACILANLEVNTGITSRKKYLSKNGDLCLSNSEKKITDFLINNKILFLKEVPYSKIFNDKTSGRMISDWLLEDGTVVEYFGMSRNKKYAKNMKRKIALCKKHKVNLIQILDRDLNKLEQIFKYYI